MHLRLALALLAAPLALQNPALDAPDPQAVAALEKFLARPAIAHQYSATRRLKELAGELGLAMVALSQLNRELTRRSDPRPQLADLAESDAIAQHADQVAFVHRPEVYEPDEESLRGLAEIIVAKHRHGATGTVALTWAGATTSFRNPETPAQPSAAPDAL